MMAPRRVKLLVLVAVALSFGLTVVVMAMPWSRRASSSRYASAGHKLQILSAAHPQDSGLMSALQRLSPPPSEILVHPLTYLW